MKKSFIAERKTPIITIIIITVFIGIAGYFTQKTYEISYKDEKITIEGPSWLTDEMLLTRANITAFNAQVVEKETLKHKTLLNVENVSDITISVDGEVLNVTTNNEKISDILQENDITINELDIINYSTEMRVLGGENITIKRVVKETSEETNIIEFETEIKEDNNVYEGTEKVETIGENGETKTITNITFIDGVISEENITTEVIKEVVNEVIVVGTKKKVVNPPTTNSNNSTESLNTNNNTNSNQIITTSGEALSYTKKLVVEASAYSTEGWTSKYTASGTLARVGAIAVDPKVIPLGTKMYITSSDGKAWVYGIAVAEDTGGSIKGNKIDLFFNTQKECIQFGRQQAIVYILK